MNSAKDPNPQESCHRCGVPVAKAENGYPQLCDECISLAGACCQEFEPTENDA